MKSSVTFACITLILVFILSAASQVADGADYPSRMFPALALSNWKSSVLLWGATRDNANQIPFKPLGVNSLRISEDYTKSILNEDSFLLKIDSNVYDNTSRWDGDVVFNAQEGGICTKINNYGGSDLSVDIEQCYYFPPQEDFYIVKYHINNPSLTQMRSIQLFEYISTPGCGQDQQQQGEYDENNNWVTMDMTSCGSFILRSIQSQSCSQIQVGPANGQNSPLQQWIQNQKLNDDTKAQSNALSFGSVTSVKVSNMSATDLYFIRFAGRDTSTVGSISARALSQSPRYWVQQARARYNEWLSVAPVPPVLSNNPDAMTLYTSSLLILKNGLMPKIGTIVASFHPAYGYKTWGRDGLFAAMVLDAAGYQDDAEQYFTWMAQAQLRDDGGFHTCYDWFTGGPVGFVEPQFDSAGAFLLAMYRHLMIHSNVSSSFISTVAPRVRQIESFFLKNVGAFNFAPSDYSIWEESSNGLNGQGLPTSYFTFTQSMAWAGLVAASKFEEKVFNDNQRAQQLLQRAAQIKSAVETKLWIADQGYLGRSVNSETLELDTRPDSSSMAAIYLGLVTDARNQSSHRAMVTANLTRLEAGIARYWGDPFFFNSIYNPGGQEVGAASPPWGVVTMFTGWAELLMGLRDETRTRLEWMVKYAAPGPLPVGEAIDGVSGNYVMTASPDLYEHGGVFILGALLYDNLTPPLGPLMG